MADRGVRLTDGTVVNVSTTADPAMVAGTTYRIQIKEGMLVRTIERPTATPPTIQDMKMHGAHLDMHTPTETRQLNAGDSLYAVCQDSSGGRITVNEVV